MLVPRVSQILPKAKLVISGHSPHTSCFGMGPAGGEAGGSLQTACISGTTQARCWLPSSRKHGKLRLLGCDTAAPCCPPDVSPHCRGSTPLPRVPSEPIHPDWLCLQPHHTVLTAQLLLSRVLHGHLLPGPGAVPGSGTWIPRPGVARPLDT